jgi:hypothetical protein
VLGLLTAVDAMVPFAASVMVSIAALLLWREWAAEGAR